MPITSIIAQPTENGLAAAYRPVVLRATATRADGEAIPPVVYCDIYFNDVFYKTLSKSQYTKLNIDTNTEWEFDIQDAAQEYLQKFLGSNGEYIIVEAAPIITKVFCKFRSSGYEGGSGLTGIGFIEPDGTAPIQATSSSPAVSGTGTASNNFYIVNATLQHADNQNLYSHLYYFKKGTWTGEALPLTHRPNNYKVLPGDSDVFPILYLGNKEFKKLKINFRNCGQSSFGSLEKVLVPDSGSPSCGAIISDLTVEPNGSGWLVNWDLISGTPAKYIVSSPLFNGGVPVETTETEFQFDTDDLSAGDNLITVRPVCIIEDESYLGAAKTVNIEVDSPGCIVADISEPIILGDATEDVPYSTFIPLLGTAPFSLVDVDKPAWMTTFAVSGSNILIAGTPSAGDIADDVAVSFILNNCGVVNDSPYETTINVKPAVEPGLYNGEMVWEDCEAAADAITDIKYNGVSVTPVSGSFPITFGETRQFMISNVAANGTLRVYFDNPNAGNIRIEGVDSSGGAHCNSGIEPAFLDLPFFDVESSGALPISVSLKCGICG